MIYNNRMINKWMNKYSYGLAKKADVMVIPIKKQKNCIETGPFD